LGIFGNLLKIDFTGGSPLMNLSKTPFCAMVPLAEAKDEDREGVRLRNGNESDDIENLDASPPIDGVD